MTSSYCRRKTAVFHRLVTCKLYRAWILSEMSFLRFADRAS